jgi:hypothetical protein
VWATQVVADWILLRGAERSQASLGRVTDVPAAALPGLATQPCCNALRCVCVPCQLVCCLLCGLLAMRLCLSCGSACHAALLVMWLCLSRGSACHVALLVTWLCLSCGSACHVALQDLSAENERLRLSSSAARETAARQTDELKQLQKDNARMAASLVGAGPALAHNLIQPVLSSQV